MYPRRIRLQCGFTLGDIVALTGAVRELHEQYPSAFETDVETSAPEVWWHNPHVTRLRTPAQVVECDKVLIDRTGARGKHYVAAYLDLLNAQLGTSAVLRRVAGDIYLSQQEKDWYSDIWNLCGEELPFWIVCPGGKFDLPIKWWSHDRYQNVVNHFRGRIQFVQVGNWGNYHPKLEGAIDLRGKTQIRDLIHLTYYAQGVLCGVTSLMHLAAAVPTESGRPRQAVVVAGAREAAVWEKYPGHYFLSSDEEVECRHCWKHRHIDLPDRPGNSAAEIRCTEIANALPRCMDLISAERVIEALEFVLATSVTTPLSTGQQAAAERAITLSAATGTFDEHNIHPLNALEKAERFIAAIPRYPSRRFGGRGIVLCGGGASYFTNAWVCINMLRFHGCNLPIELWYLGRAELDKKMEALIAPLGVKCINARELMNRYPMRNPLGWELKSYALLHSSFRELLLLDADNVAVRNPEFLFDTPEFQKTGAIFWPDYRRLGARRPIWKVCGVRHRDEAEFESGQMVIDKERCWAALNLSFWYNDHSEFFYQYIHGDKETFHMAWRKLDQNYSMVPHPIERLEGTMCQHDFERKRLFQHRNLVKWSLWGGNTRVSGFLYETQCLDFIEKLRGCWNGTIRGHREFISRDGFSFRKGTYDQNIFTNVALYNEYALPERFAPADLIIDIGAHIGSFAATCHARGSRSIVCYEASRENARLARKNLKPLAGIKVISKAVLDRSARVSLEAFPADETGQNTGGSAVYPGGSGETQAIPLDAILRRHAQVRLLKLDCEGSEWPILSGSKELHRVKEICGEFHQMPEHPFCPGVGPLNRALLKKLLKKHFPSVTTQLDKRGSNLGKFWASKLKPENACPVPDAFRRHAPAAREAPRQLTRADCGP
jgi:FkbM family methyltransferase